MVAIGVFAVALGYLYQRTAGKNITGGNSGGGTGASVAAVAAACDQLRSELGNTIVVQSDPTYANLSTEGWSQTTWMYPTCIAVPASSSDVQRIVSLLGTRNIPFAIRSGGHSPNPRDASIDTGVLIATDNLNQVAYDAPSGLVSIGSGARWDAVYTALDQYNVTVVGGRVMDVGVGGLTLGSGLSYLSDLYGMVCDNVVSYEVVLADGTAVEATSSSYSDLFWALKGGGNNFGIVTGFKSTTVPMGQIWGGLLVYSPDQMPDLMQALATYQTTPDKDLYANLVVNLVATNASVLLTLVYLKPVARPTAFAPFYELTPVSDLTGFMSLHELMAGFPSPEIPRWTWYTNTFEPDSQLYDEISSLLLNEPEVASIAALQAGTLVATAQPISANVALAGEAHGGNALGLQAVNQTWFALNVGWYNAEDDDTAYGAIESLHDKIETLAKNAGVDLQYIFMNDANIKQPVIASYGTDNVRRLQDIQHVYDPELIFQKLVRGGQKVPAS
ncbi:hypothetical protein SCUP515_10183 [Seiridium cupressi]